MELLPTVLHIGVRSREVCILFKVKNHCNFEMAWSNRKKKRNEHNIMSTVANWRCIARDVPSLLSWSSVWLHSSRLGISYQAFIASDNRDLSFTEMATENPTNFRKICSEEPFEEQWRYYVNQNGWSLPKIVVQSLQHMSHYAWRTKVMHETSATSWWLIHTMIIWKRVTQTTQCLQLSFDNNMRSYEQW